MLTAAATWLYLVSALGLKPTFAQAITVPQSKSEPTGDKGQGLGLDQLKLSEFLPESKLRSQSTQINQASFPVVDIHTHFSIRFKDSPESLAAFVQVMSRNQIAVCISLDGTLGPRLDAHVRYLQLENADRFGIFANLDFQGDATQDRPAEWACNQPDFVHRCVIQLQHAHEQGLICGLKIFKQLGLGYRQADGSLWKVDDTRLDPLWAKCGELGLPVLMHIGDPSAFFDTVDRTNERVEELSRHPDWAFPADRFPSRNELHVARNRIVERHPTTRFIFAHLGNDAEDLRQTAEWLDRYPNVFVEFASRISELGRQPFSAQQFLEKYADRVLFGTDGPWPEERLKLYWRFLETKDEYFPYSENSFPPQGLWRIYGVQLSTSALRKIYYQNAARLIPGVASKLQRLHPGIVLASADDRVRGPKGAFNAISNPGELQHVFQLGNRILTGPQPKSSDAFRTLQELDVSAIISVDGLKPDLEMAAGAGLAYVHIPFGYNRVPESAQAAIAAAMLRYPGKIYIHCHHGKQRGPTAGAIAAMIGLQWNHEQAIAFLEAAGTGKEYTGLWDDVRHWKPVDDEVIRRVQLKSIDPSPTLAAEMAGLDRQWELRHKLMQSDDQLTAQQVELRRWSTLVREHLLESRRLAADGSANQPEASLVDEFSDGLSAAEALNQSIDHRDWDHARKWADQLHLGCRECHDGYR